MAPQGGNAPFTRFLRANCLLGAHSHTNNWTGLPRGVTVPGFTAFLHSDHEAAATLEGAVREGCAMGLLLAST